MEALFETVFETYINQPASMGLVMGIYVWAHNQLEKQWRKFHLEDEKEIKKTIQQQAHVVNKVDKYLTKFEGEQSCEKQRKVDHIIDTAKNSTTIIMQKALNYFMDPANLEKSSDQNYSDLLQIAQEQMASTWERLTAEGLHWEVKLMQETSELLMPTFANEAKFICEIYNTEGINGAKTETIKRLLKSFELMIVNSWDKYFRKIAYS